MSGATFNARQAWDALSPQQQRQIGESALMLDVATKAQCDVTLAYEVMCRWSAAEQAAWILLGQAGCDPDDYPGGPELSDG